MKQITNEGVTRYQHGNYVITIIEKQDEFEAWINRKNNGIIMLMFCTPKAQRTLNGDSYRIGYKGFLAIVRANIPSYAKQYDEQYNF